MDTETGEINRDCETGELLSYDFDNETGELPSNDSTTTTTTLPPKRTTFKIPSKCFPKKVKKAVGKKAHHKSDRDWSPAFLFLLPTIFVYPALTTIIIAALEVILHTWAHRVNKKLENKDVYFKSPMHIIASEFCAKCRDAQSMDKIEKLQDKRTLRRNHYEYVKRIVT